MSIFAIGDIHGDSAKLDGLLAQLPLTDRDTLVFLGDYVDRGRDCKGVVERLMRLQNERGDRCICLLGNHEHMMLDYWRQTRGKWRLPGNLILDLLAVPDYGPRIWQSVGGEATLSSYCGDIPEEHVAWMASLPLIHHACGFTFVHAGVRPTGSTARGEMLWGATGFWGTIDAERGEMIPADLSAHGTAVIVGHAAFDEPQVGPGYIAIDTGCGVGGPLTSVQLPENVFYQELPTRL